MSDEDIVPKSRLPITTKIVAAYVSNNPVPAADLSALIASIHSTLGGLGSPSGIQAATNPPAVSIKKSITPGYLICLEDGKKLKMLKRYLRSRFGLSPDDYRTKWGLPHDYPMVAANYAKVRSDFAKKFGLGRVGKNPGRKPKASLVKR